MITIQKFHLYSLKVSANVKISVECFENFGEANAPNASPPCLRAWFGMVRHSFNWLHTSCILISELCIFNSSSGWSDTNKTGWWLVCKLREELMVLLSFECKQYDVFLTHSQVSKESFLKSHVRSKRLLITGCISLSYFSWITPTQNKLFVIKSGMTCLRLCK